MADPEKKLLLLVPILAQALLTLVRGHLMPLVFFSVWHNPRGLKLVLLDGSNENLGRLERGNVVLRDGHCGSLGDVACSLLSPMLDDEAAETTEVNRVALCK